MTTSPSPLASGSPLSSNGASGASLPRWRLWLQTLNWRRDPGVEQHEIQYEQRRMQHEQRMKQLANEIEQIERETEQLKQENKRLAAIESRLARFEREHLSGSNPLSSTGDSSPS